jgi:hypothetical protein
VGLKAGLDAVEKRKKFLPLPEIERIHPADDFVLCEIFVTKQTA